MAVATLVATAACSTRRQAATTPGAAAEQTVEMQPATSQPHVIGLPPVQAMPQATVFRMSGDYADNLPLNLSPDGTLASYPAPSDITAESAPLPLAGGWWLDRRGVNASTVFSSYTLSEYASLPEAPSPEKLLASIIPGARVTAVERLPMSPVQAAADTAAVNAYLRGATFSLPAKR